jgi:outer membrane protein TolC
MNNNKIYAAFLVFLGLFLSGAAADEDAAGVQKGGVKYSLSVQDAVDTALKNNVSIKRQEITLNAAERSKNHSWNSLSPSISVGAAAGVPVDALSDSKSDYTASLGLSATASLSLSANLYTTMKSAKLNYEQSKISFEEALRTIEFSVRQSYYELIYEKENIKLQEANLKVAKQQYENNLAKYNSGRLSEVDALSAEVNYKAKIPTVESARASYQNAMDSFKQVLGLMIDDEVELTGSLNDYLYLDEIAVDEKTVTSSSIKNLELKIESAKTSVLDKRFSAFAPSLNASFKWEEKTWYAGYTGKEEAEDPKKSASLTLSASIPLDGLLPWSSKNDAVDSAKDTLKDYELQLENEKKTFVRTIGSSLRSIKQSQEAIRYKQANVELAQRTYDMTLEAYNRGTKDLLTLQNANNTLLSAQLSLNSETLTLSKNILSLENTAGLKAGELVKK